MLSIIRLGTKFPCARMEKEFGFLLQRDMILNTCLDIRFVMKGKKYAHHFITVPKMEQLPFSAAEGAVTGKTDTRIYIDNEMVEGCNTHILHIGLIDVPSTNPFTEDHVTLMMKLYSLWELIWIILRIWEGR